MMMNKISYFINIRFQCKIIFKIIKKTGTDFLGQHFWMKLEMKTSNEDIDNKEAKQQQQQNYDADEMMSNTCYFFSYS